MKSARLSPQRLITVFAARMRLLLSSGRRPGPMPQTRHRLHFLIVRIDQIGDTILTTPFFRELRRSFPGSHCTVVVRAAAAALFETNPNVDLVLTMPVVLAWWLPEWTRKFVSACILYKQHLRDSQYDVVISPRWDVDLDLATFVTILADGRTTVGYTESCSPLKRRWNAGFNQAFSVRVDAGPAQHEVRRSLDLLRAIGGTVSEEQLQLPLLESDKAWGKAMLATALPDETLVAIGFATNNGPSREWPHANYAEVIRSLGKSRHVRAVLLSLPREKARADKLAGLIGPDAQVVVGTGLRDFAALLAQCTLFIGNDSGLAHLAAAVDLPVIVISPHPSDGDPNHLHSPVRFAPFCRTSRVLRPLHGWDECLNDCSTQNEPHCILSISTERVVEAASELLLARSSSFSGRHVAPLTLKIGTTRPLTSTLAFSRPSHLAQLQTSSYSVRCSSRAGASQPLSNGTL